MERGFAFARTLGDAMQPAAVNLMPSATPQQAAGVLTLKVLAGDVAAIGTGNVVRAEVTSVAQGRAELQVNGQAVTVRAQPALTPGTELAIQVTPGGIEAVVIPPTPTGNPNPNARPTAAAPPAPAVVVAKAAVPQAATSPVIATLTTPTQAVAPQPTGAPVPQRVSTDGTVSPTSASAAPGRPATAIAPAPPTVTRPTVVDPNVPVRTTTPAATQVAGQLVPSVVPRTRQPATDTTTARAAPTVPTGRGPRTPVPQQLSVVEVLTPARDGAPRVRIDGRPQQFVESAEPLTPGTKFVARVDRTAAGARIAPVPPNDSPLQTVAVAAALLKQDRPLPVAQALPQLAKELTAVPVPANTPAVSQAVTEVREAVRTILPDAPRPPSAEQLKSLVEDGGQKYEGKLARQAEGGEGPSRADLKGALLRLFEAVPAVAHAQYPAAKLTLDGIEQQQAANVLSQQTGGPLVLQVPFPDGPHWRTMHLAVEPEAYTRAADERTRPFRMLMHVPLSELGDTWIDAGMSGSQFRAVLYLEEPAVRDRVRGVLPDLRTDLSQIGFTDVLLDVRPTTDLTDRQRQQGAAMTAGVPASTSVIDARA